MTTRELDAFIEEHVMFRKPQRWSNGQQKYIPCGWFEEYRVHNIDSGGDVRPIDFVPNYSTTANDAEKVVRAMHQRGYMMDLWYGDHVQVWFKDVGGVRVQHSYAVGISFAEAVCRAAFNTLKPDAIAATLGG
jgi:hypothetical protein